LKNLACVDEGCVAFDCKIVVENRISVWVSEKNVGSVAGRKNWKAAFCDNQIR